MWNKLIIQLAVNKKWHPRLKGWGPSQPWGSLDIVMLSLTIFVSLFFFFSLILDTKVLFVHPEYYDFFSSCALENNPKLSLNLDDMKNLFNPCLDGGSSRVRFYSWLFWIFDTKFRLLLFQFTPFIPPTISLTWLFTSSLLPFYFFNLMKNLSCGTRVSLLSTALLMCSQGVLSSYGMFFHAAKPMSLVFLVVNLYIASVLNDRVLRGVEVKNQFYFKWFFVLLASLFWDELFYVFFLIAPLLFRGSFFRKEVFAPFFIMNLSLFSIFLLMVFVVAPHYTFLLYGTRFNFIGDMMGLSEGGNHINVRTISFDSVSYNMLSFINSHMNFSMPVEGSSGGRENNFSYWAFFFFSFFASLGISYRKRISPYVAPITLSLFIFFVFQQALLTRRDGYLIYGAHYWGSPFSIFFSMWMGLLLGSLRMRWRYLCYPVVMILCLANYRHTLAALKQHIGGNYDTESRKLSLNREKVQAFSYDLIFDGYNNKENPCYVKKILKGQPHNSVWIYQEVVLYWNWKLLLEDVGEKHKKVEELCL